MESQGDNVTAVSFILLSWSGIECDTENQDVYLDVLQEGRIENMEHTQLAGCIVLSAFTHLEIAATEQESVTKTSTLETVTVFV